MRENPGKGQLLVSLLKKGRLKQETVAVGKRPGLAKNDGRVVHHFRVDGGHDGGLFHGGNDPWRVFQRSMHGRQHVIHVDDHGLAFDDRVTSRCGFLVVDGLVAAANNLGSVLGGDSGFAGLLPYLQIVVLILQRVGQFVSQDGFLSVGVNPVQQRNHFRLFVVETGNTLPLGLHHELPQIEISRQQTELLHAYFRAGEALRVLGTGETFAKPGFGFVLADEPSLDRSLAREAGVRAGKRGDFIHQLEQLLGVLGAGLHLRRFAGARAAGYITQTLHGLRLLRSRLGRSNGLTEVWLLREVRNQKNEGDGEKGAKAHAGRHEGLLGAVRFENTLFCREEIPGSLEKGLDSLRG